MEESATVDELTIRRITIREGIRHLLESHMRVVLFEDYVPMLQFTKGMSTDEIDIVLLNFVRSMGKDYKLDWSDD